MIRLSSAQVTRIKEHLHRFENNSMGYRSGRPLTPIHIRIEELVEDIIKEVLPCEVETKNELKRFVEY